MPPRPPRLASGPSATCASGDTAWIAPAQERMRPAISRGASNPCAPCGWKNCPRLGSFQTVKRVTRGRAAVAPAGTNSPE